MLASVLEVLIAPAAAVVGAVLAGATSDRIRAFFDTVFRRPRRKSRIVRVQIGGAELVVELQDADDSTATRILREAVLKAAAQNGMSDDMAQRFADQTTGRLLASDGISSPTRPDVPA